MFEEYNLSRLTEPQKLLVEIMYNIILQAQQMGLEVAGIIESLDFLTFFMKGILYSNSTLPIPKAADTPPAAPVEMPIPTVHSTSQKLPTGRVPMPENRVSARVQVQNELKRLFEAAKGKRMNSD